MEDYEQKINSGNVFLQSQAITKLCDTLLEKHKNETTLYETEEVKMLWKTANTGGATEATLAMEALLTLVRASRLPAPATLQNFLADVTNAKCPSVLVQGVTDVVLLLSTTEEEENISCPFTGPPTGPTHPFVTLLSKRGDLAPALLQEAAYLLRHPDQRVREGSTSQLRPLLLYMFCLTEDTSPVAKPLLTLLSSSQIHHVLVPLLCRVATLIRDTSRNHVERKVMVLTALAEAALRENLARLQSAILPCLLMAIPLALVLEREVMKQKSLALEVFPMVLYRLGREPDPTTRLTILYTLPSLAVNKGRRGVIEGQCRRIFDTFSESGGG